MAVLAEQHATILEWIDAVSAERRLKGGKRRYDLLSYLVREELEGRGESLKAYAIALDVLGRGADFDPSTDSIVRVEVARLRDALELYYARSNDPFEPKVLIPKGRYRSNISLALVPEPESDAPKGRAFLDSQKAPWPKYWKLVIGSSVLAVALAIGTLLVVQKPNVVSAAKPSLMPQVFAEVGSTRPGEQEIAQLFVQHVNDVFQRFGQLYTVRDQKDFLTTGTDQISFVVKLTTSPLSYSNEVLVEVHEFGSEELVFSEALSIREPARLIDYIKFENDLAQFFSVTGRMYDYIEEKVDLNSDLGCVVSALTRSANLSKLDSIGCLQVAWAHHPEVGIVGVQYASHLVSLARETTGDAQATALTQAQAVIEQVLERTPKLPGALIQMAEIAFSRGDFPTSFLFYEQVLEVNPTGGLIRGNYGIRLLQAGQTTQAAEEIQHAIGLSQRVNPIHNAYFYLATIDKQERAALRQTAYLISSEVGGILGLVSILANVEIGELERAEKGLLSLGENGVMAREAIANTFLREGFTPEVTESIVAKYVSLDIWESLFGPEK